MSVSLELLKKYRKEIVELLKCKEEDVQFLTQQTVNEGMSTERLQWVEVGEMFYYKPDNKDYSAEQMLSTWQNGSYELRINGDVVSTWKLYQMPHCCAYMISCNVYIHPDYRSLGLGTLLNKLRQDIGRILRYTAMLCTDIEQNLAQRKVLKKNGWNDIHSIVNKRTKNKVFLSVINL